MADDKTKKDKRDRNRVSDSDNYEVQYLTKKLGVSHQAVSGAIRATGSNDRKVVEDYLKKRKKQKV